MLGLGRARGSGASSPRPKRLPRWAPISKGGRRAGGEPPFYRGGSQGRTKRGELPGKGCGALISVPVVCEDIDPGASKLITRPDEHECGFLLNYRCALWTRAAYRRYAHPADSSALKHTALFGSSGPSKTGPTEETPLKAKPASGSRRRVSDCRGMRGEPASSFSCWPRLFPPPDGGSGARPVFRGCLGHPARTRGEVAEWLKAAPSEAPTRRRRLEDARALPVRPSSEDASAILRGLAEKWPSG